MNPIKNEDVAEKTCLAAFLPCRDSRELLWPGFIHAAEY